MSQDVVNADRGERSRKNLSICLQRLASVGQATVALALGVSESTVSRHKDQLDELARMLAALDLKIVPVGVRCYRPEDIEPLIALAKQRMEGLHNADQLAWEDDHIGGSRG